MKESTVESRLVRAVKSKGGLCFKFVSPSCAGVPDRIVILPDGRIIFAEIKSDAGRLSEKQRYVIGEMQKRGCRVEVIKGLDGLNKFLTEVLI